MVEDVKVKDAKQPEGMCLNAAFPVGKRWKIIPVAGAPGPLIA
ncbi:MAG: hypothetical protein QOG67_103 [Verrucomicrobiota bacterium]|jgi:hypothetical protein